jgi:hypothetical protein
VGCPSGKSAPRGRAAWKMIVGHHGFLRAHAPHLCSAIFLGQQRRLAMRRSSPVFSHK